MVIAPRPSLSLSSNFSMASHGEPSGAVQLERQKAFGPVKARQPHLLWLQKQVNCSSDKSLFKPYMEGEGVAWEEKQTFLQWKSETEFQRVLHPIRMRQKTIVLQPLVHSTPLPGYPLKVIEQPVMEHLQSFCQAFFVGMQVVLAEPLDMATLKNLTSRVHARTNRTQFLVPDLLKHLKSRRPRNAYCVVGVTLFDLYPSPEWNFVMGHALLTEGCAVFTFGRHFNSEQAPCEGEGALLGQLKHLWVLMRVMTHEICHVLGMKHCFYYRCAMNESSSIDEAINQPLFLCPVCLRKLHKALHFDILQRYVHLQHKCQELLQVSSSTGFPLDGGCRPVHSDAPPLPHPSTPLLKGSDLPHPAKEPDIVPVGGDHPVDSTDTPHPSPPLLAGPSETLNRFQQSLNWLNECLQSLNSSI